MVTNPYYFQINDFKILGTSGQNVKDIKRYTRITDPLDVLELTLEMNHICPTCPDTLRSYPFVTEDPFITNEVPHLYLAAN